MPPCAADEEHRDVGRARRRHRVVPGLREQRPSGRVSPVDRDAGARPRRAAPARARRPPAPSASRARRARSPRRSQTSAATSLDLPPRPRRASSSYSPRRSRQNSTRPGITLTAPGNASRRPTVAMQPASRGRCARRRARPRPRRRGRRGGGRTGRRPAWPASPVIVSAKRRAPAIDETTPSASVGLFEVRAPARCAPRGSRRRSPRDGAASPTAVGVEAERGERLAEGRRPSSSSSCHHASSQVPASARDAEQGACRSACPPRRRTRRPRGRTAARAGRGAEAVDDRDREQHAEDAVVAAGVGHGVEVRAEQQRGQPGLAPSSRPHWLPAASCQVVMPASASSRPARAFTAGVLGARGRRARCAVVGDACDVEVGELVAALAERSRRARCGRGRLRVTRRVVAGRRPARPRVGVGVDARRPRRRRRRP